MSTDVQTSHSFLNKKQSLVTDKQLRREKTALHPTTSFVSFVVLPTAVQLLTLISQHYSEVMAHCLTGTLAQVLGAL